MSRPVDSAIELACTGYQPIYVNCRVTMYSVNLNVPGHTLRTYATSPVTYWTTRIAKRADSRFGWFGWFGLVWLQYWLHPHGPVRSHQSTSRVASAHASAPCLPQSSLHALGCATLLVRVLWLVRLRHPELCVPLPTPLCSECALFAAAAHAATRTVRVGVIPGMAFSESSR